MVTALAQFGRAAMRRQFGLKLGDTPSGRDQRCLVGGGDTGNLGGADQVLAAPVADRLVADLQVPDWLRYRSASLE